MQYPLSLGKFITFHNKLHICLARRLGDRQYIDIVCGERLGCACQDSRLGNIGTDGADNSDGAG